MHKQVFVGGTFDGIHKGHELMLSTAFGVGEHVTIGITSDVFVAQYKHDAPHVASFEHRKQEVEAWVEKIGEKGRTEFISIDDPYEPVASGSFDAIVVSTQTKKRGEEINDKRQVKGLVPLVIVEVPMVTAYDGLPIASSRMRSGDIDKTGDITMPLSLKTALQAPLGIIHTGQQQERNLESHARDYVISVGDITTKTSLCAGIIPAVSIVDLLVRRQPFATLDLFTPEMNVRMISVRSGPGFISKEAIAAIRGSMETEGKKVIVVDGEEDLLTLPAILYAPIGAVVYYGQPPLPGSDEPIAGLVEVIVTEEKKEEARKLLEQFV